MMETLVLNGLIKMILILKDTLSIKKETNLKILIYLSMIEEILLSRIFYNKIKKYNIIKK